MSNPYPNPYEPERVAKLLQGRSHFFALSTLGAVIGALGLSYCHIRLVALLERGLCPPLDSTGNLGQYGVVFLVLAFWGTLLGAFTGLLGILRLRTWWSIYLVMILSLSILHRNVLFSYGIYSTFTFALGVILMMLPVPNFIITTGEKWFSDRRKPVDIQSQADPEVNSR